MPMTKWEQVREFQNRLDEAAVDGVEPWEFGAALLSPSMPQVWDANYCRLDVHGSESQRVEAAAATACGHAGLRHVSVVVPAEGEARRLTDGLNARGFEAVRHVSMILRTSPSAPSIQVEEVSLDAVAASEAAVRADEEPDPPELAAALAEMTRRMHRAGHGRWFAVRDEQGAIAARAWLLRDDRVAQVEDVATAPAARGRGLARAVVSAATLAALESGAELVFVVADADETTSELYLKLGFEPLGITTRFIRKPAD
jgi:predicted GNAT family acetyltransferase